MKRRGEERRRGENKGEDREEKYEKGEGRLLPNFKCFRELYMNKISSQENMAKEMRKQQKEMKESSPMDSKVKGL